MGDGAHSDGSSDDLGRLVESVVDGSSIDWDSVANDAAGQLRRLIDELRVVDAIADAHALPADETGPSIEAHPAGEPFDEHGQPERWGQFLLVRKLGEGAFGDVYEARDELLDVSRALKLVRREVVDRVSSSSIIQEAQKLVRVRHPNVVVVHGAGTHNGRIGFWMDLVQGQTLAERVASGSLSAREAASVGQDLCLALSAVHQAGLVHRDVKAENVMRAHDGGRVVLVDFGAGEFVASPSSRAQGTPLYVAPEIFEQSRASAQSDIYALGVLLYYLVTARFPVEGKNLEDLKQAHRAGRRQWLKDVRPELPDSFVQAVERALDPDPARRFASPGEMDHALAGLNAVTTEPEVASWWLRAIRVFPAALAILTASAWVIGFAASRIFERTLGFPADFLSGAADYFRVGREALLPFVIWWLLCTIVVGAGWCVHLMAGKVWAPMVAPLRTRIDRCEPVSLAAGLLTTGIVVWAGCVWLFLYVLSMMIGLQGGTLPVAQVYGAMGPENWVHFVGNTSAAIGSFVLAGLAIGWVPTFEARSQDRATVRRIRTGVLVVVAGIVMTASLPRRLVWESFDPVMYENRLAVVLATKGDDVLLFDDGHTRRVRRAETRPLNGRPRARRLFDHSAPE
jgi:serine/threonine-protein kinase